MTKSTIIPIITPIKYINERTVMFSFKFLLVLNNSNIPKPLPVNSPARSVPIVINLIALHLVILN